MRRRTAAIALLLLPAAFAGGVGVATLVDSTDEPARTPVAASPSAPPRPVTAADYLRYHPATPRQPYTALLEPFDYEPAPPLEATDVDGYYLRIVRLGEVGGPRWALPIHCLRCPAFRVDPGVETLLLYRGRWWLEHQMSGFRALGHYVVRGDRVSFFNDANCSGTRGTYRWSLRAQRLRFEVIDDPCPFEDERADDLTFSPWTRVRPCRSGIEYWWPALIGCSGGFSGVRFR